MKVQSAGHCDGLRVVGGDRLLKHDFGLHTVFLLVGPALVNRDLAKQLFSFFAKTDRADFGLSRIGFGDQILVEHRFGQQFPQQRGGLLEVAVLDRFFCELHRACRGARCEREHGLVVVAPVAQWQLSLSGVEAEDAAPADKATGPCKRLLEDHR